MTHDDSSNHDRIGIHRRTILKAAGVTGVGLTSPGAFSGSATAAIGDELGVVELPDNVDGTFPEDFNCSVAGTFDGQFYSTMVDGETRPGVGDSCTSDILQIYDPPAGGDGTATKVSEKNIVDGDDSPVPISALTWDPSRDRYWGAWGGDVWLINPGDPTTNDDAVAELQFSGAPGRLIDGLAFDGATDTIWYTPDVSTQIWQFNPDGTQTAVSPITPKNADGNAAGSISGVAVGAEVRGQPTLYVARNGAANVIRNSRS